jgi:hypothetical protein
LLVTAPVTFLLWREPVWSRALLSLAAFCALVYLWELLRVRRNQVAAAAAMESGPAVAGCESGAQFTFVFHDESGYWYQRTIQLEGDDVYVRISNRPGVYEAALPYAQALVADPDLLARKFKEFKAAQAPRFPEYQKEVLDLEIQGIDFVSQEKPASASVYFWDLGLFECEIDNGEFRGLRIMT